MFSERGVVCETIHIPNFHSTSILIQAIAMLYSCSVSAVFSTKPFSRHSFSVILVVDIN